MRNVNQSLEGMSIDELRILAKRLGLSGYSGLRKADLIKCIGASDGTSLQKQLFPTWWQTYHNHVYGLVSVVSLALSVVFFAWPGGTVPAPAEHAVSPEDLMLPGTNVARSLDKNETSNELNRETLLKKFPEGYYEFVDSKYAIIPTNPNVTQRFSLDWEGSNVKRIGGSFIYIKLRKFVYKPRNIEIRNMHVILDNRPGAVADGMFFDGISLEVELLTSNVETTRYVIGLKPLGAPRKKIKLRSDVLPLVHELGVGTAPFLNTKSAQYLSIESFLITSAWE